MRIFYILNWGAKYMLLKQKRYNHNLQISASPCTIHCSEPNKLKFHQNPSNIIKRKKKILKFYQTKKVGLPIIFGQKKGAMLKHPTKTP
jgi:hypothetical protein